MSAKEITVLMVEPGKHPKVTTLKDDLDSLQKAVSIGADYQGLRLLDTHEFARLAKTVFGDRVGEMSAERGRITLAPDDVLTKVVDIIRLQVPPRAPYRVFITDLTVVDTRFLFALMYEQAVCLPF